MTDDELIERLRAKIWLGSDRTYVAKHPRDDGPQTILLPDGREVMVEIKLFDVTGAEA